jgi:hypothetical protein
MRDKAKLFATVSFFLLVIPLYASRSPRKQQRVHKRESEGSAVRREDSSNEEFLNDELQAFNPDQLSPASSYVNES